ncbi:CPBP family intramembrane metalloprotease [Defluviimonas sp. WL0002]|uniref:CPBP family intramembrane metalloprotease n=1 Tax=Albidovulum marisflavi TaxID=2984159 RepID=A0ABT2ZDH4_9RHOB|nr:CPBP family intramembrane glutamic endopeptidase [Defluviimonas sp. WL0002]MCV2869156.1 CPBP family intramembrane metalloprotease [Defluviimonas sp. WL0002]
MSVPDPGMSKLRSPEAPLPGRGVFSGPLGQAAVFYILAFTLALGIALAAPRFGEAVALLTMFTPLAAVLILRLVLVRDGWSPAAWADAGLHRLGLAMWPMAVAFPVALLLPGYIIVWLMPDSGPVLPQWSDLPRDLFRLCVTILVGACLGALGEEIGWRGYLFPRLMHLGPGRAMLLTGALHGIWHLPLMLLTPFYHSAGAPWIVVPLFLGVMTLAGTFYGHLRLASASIWPVALAHRTVNSLWDRLDTATVAEPEWMLEYVAGETGVTVLILLLAYNLVFWRRRARAVNGTLTPP